MSDPNMQSIEFHPVQITRLFTPTFAGDCVLALLGVSGDYKMDSSLYSVEVFLQLEREWQTPTSESGHQCCQYNDHTQEEDIMNIMNIMSNMKKGLLLNTQFTSNTFLKSNQSREVNLMDKSLSQLDWAGATMVRLLEHLNTTMLEGNIKSTTLVKP